MGTYILEQSTASMFNLEEWKQIIYRKVFLFLLMYDYNNM